MCLNISLTEGFLSRCAKIDRINNSLKILLEDKPLLLPTKGWIDYGDLIDKTHQFTDPRDKILEGDW